MTTKTAVSSPNGKVSFLTDLRTLYRRKHAVETLIRSLEKYDRLGSTGWAVKPRPSRTQ